MKIQSFQGIKNAGCQTYVVDKAHYKVDEYGRIVVFPRMVRTDFHVELTNENGSDLDEFKKLLNDYPNRFNPNALSFTQTIVMNEETGTPHFFYEINNKETELNGRTLKSFVSAHKLFKKIKSVNPDDMAVENKYLNSLEVMDAFKFYVQFFLKKDESGKEHLDNNFFRMTESLHETAWVKRGAKALTKSLSNRLTEFFTNED